MRPFVAALVAELAPRARSFALRFVSDREMRRLNASFRRIDRPTDVLSFPGDLAARGGQEPGWPADVEGDHLGDVAVSVPTARRQAAELGHATAHELRLLVIHGLLHCLGHDHESDDGEMDQLERSLRCRYLEATPVAAAANAGRSHGR